MAAMDGQGDLQRDLEQELALVAAGLPMGQELDGRLLAAGSRVLRRHGIREFKLKLVRDGPVLRLLIHTPPHVPRVQDVQLGTRISSREP